MKLKSIFVGAAVSLALVGASAPAFAGSPNFCPQENTSFYNHLSWHLPISAIQALFGFGGTCSN